MVLMADSSASTTGWPAEGGGGRRAERIQKELEKQTDRLTDLKQATQQLQDRTAGNFTSDVFGSDNFTLRGVMDMLSSDTKRADEYQVMVDTHRPLLVSAAARSVFDAEYPFTWATLEEGNSSA